MIDPPAPPAAAPRIQVEDVSRPDVLALLEEHLTDLRRISPPGSVHALDLAGLRQPQLTFWTARGANGVLLGCGALRQLDAAHGEVKSMRTARPYLRQGVAAALLRHIIATARARGCTRLSLETGAQPAFAPAHRLYARHGFTPCAPFADYRPDPSSVFLTLGL